MNERSLRLDLVIALIAVCVSTIAAVATVYQSRIIADQYSATVWPYVSVSYTLSQNNLELELRNDGLGPALIRSADLRYDGKPVESWNQMMKIVMSHVTAHRHAALHMSASDINGSSIVRAGDSLHLFTVGMTGAGHLRVSELRSHLDLTVCYCSLLGRCWMTLSDGPPRDMRRCPNAQIRAGSGGPGM